MRKWGDGAEAAAAAVVWGAVAVVSAVVVVYSADVSEDVVISVSCCETDVSAEISAVVNADVIFSVTAEVCGSSDVMNVSVSFVTAVNMSPTAKMRTSRYAGRFGFLGGGVWRLVGFEAEEGACLPLCLSRQALQRLGSSKPFER